MANKLFHIAGFVLIGIGILEKSIFFVLAGGVAQELGHFYQYAKTRNPKENPLYCIRPQLLFAYPLFALIILYVMLAK